MVKASSEVLEIEVDTPRNANLFFGMLQRTVRGCFDVTRAMRTDKAAAELLAKWPEPIPGQRLQLDLSSGEGALVETLHLPEHVATRELIEQRGMRLEAERTTFGAVHVPTWLYWMRESVRAGKAKLVRGTLPEVIEGEPVKRFHSPEVVDPLDRLAASLERQNDLMAQLLAKLAK